MPTIAHHLSKNAIIDPTYSSTELSPAPVKIHSDFRWFYPPSAYELFMIERMRQDFIKHKRKVGYPAKFPPPPLHAVYTAEFKSPQELLIHFANPGSYGHSMPTVKAEFNGVEIPVKFIDFFHGKIELNNAGTLKLDVTSGADELPIIGADGNWQIIIDGQITGAEIFDGSEISPHWQELPEFMIEIEANEKGYYDIGCEVYGKIECQSDNMVRLTAGESIEEMQNLNPEYDEQDLSMHFVTENKIESNSPLAFRYFKFLGGKVKNVRCRLLFTPLQYRGAFAATEKLTKIWMYSAYTLRLCMHHFLLDGVKRDHVPWAGDLALSIMANAFSFHDAEIVRRTLTLMSAGGNGCGDINAAADFSCYLLICHELYLKYFDDIEYIRKNADKLSQLADYLLSRCDERGFFTKDIVWTVIDWADGDKSAALQGVFYMALKSTAGIFQRLNNENLQKKYSLAAENLKKSIYKNIFDTKSGLFRSNLEGKNEFTRHLNIFAILSDLAEKNDRPAIINALKSNNLPPLGTPFTAALELWALIENGERKFALEKIEKLWGDMLELGATTFFEAFISDEQKKYTEFYGRPFGKSLCHAWASGPVFLLPMIFFGVKVSESTPGEYEYDLLDNCIDSACTVPTSSGQLEFSCIDGKFIQSAL